MATPKDFIGTWKLLRCEHRFDDGRIVYPLGKDAAGLLVYTAEGYMSGCLMNPNRPRFKTTELFAGAVEEKAQAMEGYVHYGGRFELQTDHVIHHVEISLFPNWIGSRQQRYFKFANGEMELFTNAFVAEGGKQTAHLFWKRAK